MKVLNQQFLQHCHDNNLEGVTDCLSRGADVTTESGGWFGLRIAYKKNYSELRNILIKHLNDAQIEIPNSQFRRLKKYQKRDENEKNEGSNPFEGLKEYFLKGKK